MKMPAPTIPPMTIIVASKRPTCRSNPGEDVCGCGSERCRRVGRADAIYVEARISFATEGRISDNVLCWREMNLRKRVRPRTKPASDFHRPIQPVAHGTDAP